jgi:hypothetical protein
MLDKTSWAVKCPGNRALVPVPLAERLPGEEWKVTETLPLYKTVVTRTIPVTTHLRTMITTLRRTMRTMAEAAGTMLHLSTITLAVDTTLLLMLSLPTVPLHTTTTILATTTGDRRVSMSPPLSMANLYLSTMLMDRITAGTIITTKVIKAATTPLPTIMPMTMATLEPVVITSSPPEASQAVEILTAEEATHTMLLLTGLVIVAGTQAVLQGFLRVTVTTKVLLLITERLNTVAVMTTILRLMVGEAPTTVVDTAEGVDIKA